MVISFPIIHFPYIFFVFFFNDTATTEIYTLSLHDALPIYVDHVQIMTDAARGKPVHLPNKGMMRLLVHVDDIDRKSTRLNSSHGYISYAVFCLKKKKKTTAADTNTTNSRKPAIT